MARKEKWLDQEETVVAWLEEGYSYEQVADATGIPKGTLWGIARRVKARQGDVWTSRRREPQSKAGHSNRVWTPEQCRQVLELQNQGLSYGAISRRTGVPPGSIHRCLVSAIAAETHVLDPAVAQPEAPSPEIPSPEEYVLAFVEYVESERRTLREANRELAVVVASLREQLDVARESAAAAAREVNDYVFANKAWREQLSLLGKVVAQ